MSSCTTGARQGEVPAYGLTAPLDAGQRTQVLILGTEHLGALGDELTPRMLSSLLDGLETFGPDVIAVEQLPPEEINRLAQDATDPAGPAAQLLAAFAGDALTYGREAQAALGLTYRRAAELADSLLHAGGSPSVEERRRLILHLLAAYDVPSSVLQWSYLPVEARVPDGGLSPSIAGFLSQHLDSPAEHVSIGVALARRLALQEIASVDDHVDDEVGLATGLNHLLAEELEDSSAFAELRDSPYFEEAQRRLPDAAATGDLLSLYLEINSLVHLKNDVAAQWHLFYRTHLKSNLDRTRAALWEARNLNIAGRIRQASAFHSGGRVLVVIGAAHKPFLDQYLGQMMDMDVVHLADILER